MTLKAPDGTGIKGGIVDYHVRRMLTAIELIDEFPEAKEFISTLVYHHARLAARAALNRIYNGRRPK